MSIGDATVGEAAGTATFTVTLDAASGQTVTVDYVTSAGTAIEDTDYTGVSGTVTFVPGSTAETIDVPILPDALDEDNETYTVLLSSPTNATIGDGSGLGTITDDDPTPSLTIDNVSVAEGDAGSTTDATFTVSLSAASGRTVTVVV